MMTFHTLWDLKYMLKKLVPTYKSQEKLQSITAGMLLFTTSKLFTILVVLIVVTTVESLDLIPSLGSGPCLEI